MGNYIFHFENWLGISSSSTYAGQKKTFTRISVTHRDFSYLLSHFYICKWKDLSTFSMPFIRMIITSSNNPPKNRRCKQFGNAVSDICGFLPPVFLWVHVEIHPTCVLAYQLVWFPRSFVKYYADPVFNPLFQIKRSTPRCSQADIKTFHFWNHKLFCKPALIFV